MGIKIHCHTNLDDFRRVNWPTELPVRPQVGDVIYCKRGVSHLEVCKVRFEPNIEAKYMMIVELWYPKAFKLSIAEHREYGTGNPPERF